MKRTLLVLLGVTVFLSGVQLYAHHSFAATYHEDQTVKIEGTLVQFQFRNPHSFVHLEAPPEVRVGHVTIDGRFDVYQLGWMLRKLTHYEAAPDIWTPVAPVGEGLRAVITRATGPFGERFRDAGELSEQLRSVQT